MVAVFVWQSYGRPFLIRNCSLTVKAHPPSLLLTNNDGRNVMNDSLVNRLKIMVIGIFALAFAFALPAAAQSLLRDAETEAFLKRAFRPVLEAANLTPESVHIYLVHENSINAFVMGGQNIFINSGLLLRADDINQLLGVVAHETGHIAGGHLRRRDETAAASTTMTIASMVLGAAAIAMGGGDAGIGIIMAGQSMAQSTYLKYSRIQESKADQAAASYLQLAGISGNGLIEFFEKLQHEEMIRNRTQNPYIRSHPLNRDRIMSLYGVVEGSPYQDVPPDYDLNEEFKRIKGKLYGYTNAPNVTFDKYPATDTSFEAQYARAYAFHKDLDWDAALAEIDAMITKEPENPYFYEIKGQILVENHRVKESLIPLRNAVDLSNRETLIMTALGQALVALDDPAYLEEAKRHLELATALDNENTFAWYNLAIVYMKLDEPANASLATAERYNVMQNGYMAAMHATMALKGLKEHTPKWLRAQDILYINEALAVKQKKQRKKEERRRRNFSN